MIRWISWLARAFLLLGLAFPLWALLIAGTALYLYVEERVIHIVLIASSVALILGALLENVWICLGAAVACLVTDFIAGRRKPVTPTVEERALELFHGHYAAGLQGGRAPKEGSYDTFKRQCVEARQAAQQRESFVFGTTALAVPGITKELVQEIAQENPPPVLLPDYCWNRKGVWVGLGVECPGKKPPIVYKELMHTACSADDCGTFICLWCRRAAAWCKGGDGDALDARLCDPCWAERHQGE